MGMTWEKPLSLGIGIFIFAGFFSITPNVFGGISDELCIDENGVEILCVHPKCDVLDTASCLKPDDDDDGVSNLSDNCPFISNPNQEDSDGNGIGDACQDVDADEIIDIEDNCPFISNPNQEDSDGNGIGDSCEEEIELLVEATFPPGNKINVNLPKNPTTGSFSISLELPQTTGGKVVIKKTDAGNTAGNFGFLGSVIDFKAPCSEICKISFTFTQASLENQGITLEQVTVFHDMNENGSFENNEAIPTEITGSDPFTATANASFTSKFSVGGIKALALGALVGGGGYGGGSPPTLENLSFDGVRTMNKDGTISFGGLLIDEISSVNKFPTQTIETNVPFEIRLPFYEDSGVGALEHVALYFLHGDDNTIYDTDTFVIYDLSKPLQISDPNGYTSAVSVETIEKSAHNIDVIFKMTFELPMNATDIIVRAWDNHKRSNDIKFSELIQVVESDLNNKLNENGATISSSDNQSKDDFATDGSSILVNNFQGENLNNDLKTSEGSTYKIPVWIKYNANWWSEDEINDDDFIAGIKYLIDDDIITIPELTLSKTKITKEMPSWIKPTAGWWSQGLVSDKEFVKAIEWLIEEEIIQLN